MFQGASSRLCRPGETARPEGPTEFPDLHGRLMFEKGTFHDCIQKNVHKGCIHLCTRLRHLAIIQEDYIKSRAARDLNLVSLVDGGLTPFCLHT